MSALDDYRGHGPLAGWLAARPRPLPLPEMPAIALAATLVGVLTGAVQVDRAPTSSVTHAVVTAALVVGLLGAGGRRQPRLGWLVPGLLRAVEYLALLVLAGGGPWTYALLTALAFHHYDVVYRLRGGGPTPPRWLAPTTGGWELRVAVVLAAAVADVATPVVAALAVVLGPLLVAESVLAWRRDTAT